MRSYAANDLRIPGGGDERAPIGGDRGYAGSTEEAAMNKAPTPTAHPASDALGDVWELDLTQARKRLIAARAHQQPRTRPATGRTWPNVARTSTRSSTCTWKSDAFADRADRLVHPPAGYRGRLTASTVFWDVRHSLRRWCASGAPSHHESAAS